LQNEIAYAAFFGAFAILVLASVSVISHETEYNEAANNIGLLVKVSKIGPMVTKPQINVP